VRLSSCSALDDLVGKIVVTMRTAIALREVEHSGHKMPAPSIDFDWMILAGQQGRQVRIELTAEQKFWQAAICQAVDDWLMLVSLGHFPNVKRVTLAEVMELAEWLFSEQRDHDGFVSLRRACLGLAIDIDELRSALRAVADPEKIISDAREFDARPACGLCGQKHSRRAYQRNCESKRGPRKQAA
jgi:hypothetical protein